MNEQEKSLKLAAKMLGLPERYFGLHIDSFKIEKPGQQEAVDAVRLMLEGGLKTLLLTGLVGTGKTHLACTALTHWTDRKKGKALYTTSQRMYRRIRETWKTKESEQDIIDMFVKASLLVIDEVVEPGDDKEVSWMSEIISDRYNAEHPTILISNLSWKILKGDEPGRLASFDERAVDKMRENGDKVVFGWESYRRKK